MKQLFLTSLFICFLQISFSQSKDEEGVKNCFQSYKEAILTGEGKEAVKWVDSRTIEYYTMVLEKSISADSLEISAMPFMDKFMVLVVRYRIDYEELKEMDGKKFFIYAVNKEMVGKNSVMNVEVGEVKVEGKFAQASVVTKGVDAGFSFDFYKEKRKWKMDLTSIFKPTTRALKLALEGKEMSDEEFIIFSLELSGQKPVTSDLWRPLKADE